VFVVASPRHFPPPWSIEEANNACFIVRDSTGQALGYFYFEDEPGRAAINSSVHTAKPLSFVGAVLASSERLATDPPQQPNNSGNQ
jgi:hypothetical protein